MCEAPGSDDQTSALERQGFSQTTGLLELRVLSFGLLQDGYVGIGIFPQREKIPVVGEGLAAGSISADFMVCPCLDRVRTRQPEMCQRAGQTVLDDPAVVEDFLKLTAAAFPLPMARYASPLTSTALLLVRIGTMIKTSVPKFSIIVLCYPIRRSPPLGRHSQHRSARVHGT
jgi:hypothetical protein